MASPIRVYAVLCSCGGVDCAVIDGVEEKVAIGGGLERDKEMIVVGVRLEQSDCDLSLMCARREGQGGLKSEGLEMGVVREWAYSGWVMEIVRFQSFDTLSLLQY